MQVLNQSVERGRPASYGQEILKRRYRRTLGKVAFNEKIVLDFGCGNGAQTAEFIPLGCRILAVDIDWQDLKIFSDYLGTIKARSVFPVRYDGRALPLKDSSVDVVLSYEVLEHVADEAAALREIHRVLKPEGQFVMSVPNKSWIFETHGAHLPYLPWNRVPFFSWLPRPVHRRFAKARIYRRGEIIRLLQGSGFDVLSAEFIRAPMDAVTVPWLQRLLRATIFAADTTVTPVLSTSILVHSIKRQQS